MKFDSIYEHVDYILNKMRPYLQGDGGDVELVEVKDGIVYVRMLGACSGCSMSDVTIANVIEFALIEEVPGIIRVEAVE
ncbi:MAG: NifU family protein [Bacilli bacterium]